MPTDSYRFHPIGFVRSCYTERFGIPRQPGLVTAAEATLVICPEFALRQAFVGLDGFSHLWLIFVFHDDLRARWRPMVRPPRLGGNRKVGVFATRAPYRPTPVGLSAVELVDIEHNSGRLELRLRGADLLDGTPVLDIKPYVPYADALPHASPGFASGPPGEDWEVEFSPQARRQLSVSDPSGERQLAILIAEVLRQDPRPGYMGRDSEIREFGVRLYDLDVGWRLSGDRVLVTRIDPVAD